MSQLSKFEESEAKAGRAAREVLIVVLLAALPVLAVAAFLIGRDAGQDAAPVVEGVSAVVPFDYDEAAELSALRWQAMAKFYEQNGLLLSDVAASEETARSAARVEPSWLQSGIHLPDGVVPEKALVEPVTEPYWLQAWTYENKAGQAAAAEADATYTEQYWKLADEGDSEEAVQPAQPGHLKFHQPR